MNKILTVSDKKSKTVPVWKKVGSCLLAPAAAAGILLLVYWMYHLFPFARYMFAWGDMTQQSIPLLLDFKNILSGQFDMFLNTANAGGMSFWGVFLFFLSSPFSFLVAFIDSKDIYLFANFLVMMKMAATAFTASLFFRRQFPKLNILQHNTLAMMYAFCGYAMMYYQNMVWLDMMCVFPILLMGLCNLVQRQKVGLYILALTATVAVNYYLSYMVIVFLVLSMGIYMLFGAKKGTRRKTIALFCFGSLIAALMTAVFWLPSFAQYTHSARTTGILESLSGSPIVAAMPTKLPVILCTAVIMAVIPMFFLVRMYRCRKVRALMITYLITLIPVLLEPINKMWHTGSYQAFPVRYGYITVLMGLCVTAAFLTKADYLHRLAQPKVKTTTGMAVIAGFNAAALIAVGILLLAFKSDVISTYVGTLWMSDQALVYFMLFAGLATLVYFLIFMLHENLMMSRRVLSIALTAVMLVECIFCSSVFIGNGTRSVWGYDNAMDLAYRTETDDLMRTKLYRKFFDVNLVGAMGYNTLSHYTSLTDEDYMFAMKKLGYSSYWMEVGSNGGTLLTDILMANKYTIMKNTDTTMPALEKVYEGMVYCIVPNETVNSFGVTFAAEDIAALETLPIMSRMETQQYLSDLFYDCGEIVEPYEPATLMNVVQTEDHGRTILEKIAPGKSGYMTYKIVVDEEQTLYFDCFDKTTTALKEEINDSFEITVNGVRKESSYPSQKSNGLVELGTFKDETVRIEVKVKQDVVDARSFGLFGVKNDRIREAQAEKIPTTLRRDGNAITGTATANKDGEYLLIPMSWDKGYSIAVNGENAEIYRVFDAFMAVKLAKGENSIALSYMPQGFTGGLVLSIIGAAVFVFAMIAVRCRWIRKLRWLYWPTTIAFAVLVGVVAVIIHIIPLLLAAVPA